MHVLDRLPPRLDTPLLFPAATGGYIGLGNWCMRRWYPGARGGRFERRGRYPLRHTFPTEALAAGIPIFERARVMGTSLSVVLGYGHLARDSEQGRARLDARTAGSGLVLASTQY